ncbi:MAG: hypothetical protein LAT64_14520 [Phycisphaerales bacterium]|nr:hypothetical protein [Planctomycetota bacterium]MCH8509962.1 hypothetical protein [Phycisphaerales bacterium]
MSNPTPNRPQDPPPGRTALVSMFPLRLDEPLPIARPPVKPENRTQAQSNSLNAGK